MQTRFPRARAGALTAQDAKAWIESLITDQRTAFTVKNVWLDYNMLHIRCYKPINARGRTLYGDQELSGRSAPDAVLRLSESRIVLEGASDDCKCSERSHILMHLFGVRSDRSGPSGP